MREPSHSATFTTDFGEEFEVERAQRLRKRFLGYTGVVAGISLILFIASVAAGLGVLGDASDPSSGAGHRYWTKLFTHAINAGMYLAAFAYARRRSGRRADLLTLAYWLIVSAGVIEMCLNASRAFRLGFDLGAIGAITIFLTHCPACLFLPWTPRESVRPLVPLVLLNTGLTLVAEALGRHNLLETVGVVSLSLAVGFPGVAICWWRHSRFRDRFTMRTLRDRYGELRRELVDARRIHEALFPNFVPDGPVRFTYRYEPMRQIGGDYLYFRSTPIPGSPGHRYSLIVLDVTGHGIPAALTVNRLHGELDRVFGKNPDIPPGVVLNLLNRYVHLTLALHSVYVTAFCVRIDPDSDRLEYASGGHPPAYLRGIDGTIHELQSTALVLGAAADADFEPAPAEAHFGPGDVLIAYTDGAIEARGRDGRMLGLKGLQRIVAHSRPDPDGGWPLTILRAVEQYRFGPPADDTLVIELARPLVSAPARAPRPAVGSIAATAGA
jgi:hypothetical protein